MLKFLIAILNGSAVYLFLTPTWNLTVGSFVFMSILLGFFLCLIGMPTYLILNKWFKKNTFVNYSLKILASVALAFLLPLALARWFRIYIAKTSNLTQLGEMAMFTNGELSENGKTIIVQDFIALFVSVLVVTLIISLVRHFQHK